MTCIRCQHQACKRFGTYGRRKIQRWRCQECKATFSTSQRTIGNHYTDLDTAGKIITLMLEGMSIRAIERFTGVHRDTILSVMRTASEKARQVLNAKVQHITPKYVQMDEMWGFVHTREPNLHKDDPEEWGSTMVWLAGCPRSRGFRDLGFHGRISCDDGPNLLIFFITNHLCTSSQTSNQPSATMEMTCVPGAEVCTLQRLSLGGHQADIGVVPLPLWDAP